MPHPNNDFNKSSVNADNQSDNRKRVALFGGSFNPPHDGHFKLMSEITKTSSVDEIWMIFSHNRFKNPKDYASVYDRIDMAKIMHAHYPDVPVVFSDVEQRIGTNITADILRTLKAEEPDTDFVWVMGSDNLEQFHEWQDYEYIMENFEVIVMARPGYETALTDSVTAKQYADFQKEPDERLNSDIKGWSYINAEGFNLSSSALMKKIMTGVKQFEGAFQDVANYIFSRGLYGTGDTSKKRHPKP